MWEEDTKNSRCSLLPNHCEGRCVDASYDYGHTSVALDLLPKPRVDLARLCW